MPIDPKIGSWLAQLGAALLLLGGYHVLTHRSTAAPAAQGGSPAAAASSAGLTPEQRIQLLEARVQNLEYQASKPSRVVAIGSAGSAGSAGGAGGIDLALLQQALRDLRRQDAEKALTRKLEGRFATLKDATDDEKKIIVEASVAMTMNMREALAQHDPALAKKTWEEQKAAFTERLKAVRPAIADEVLRDLPTPNWQADGADPLAKSMGAQHPADLP